MTTTRHIQRHDFDAVVSMLARAFDDDPWLNFVARQDARRAERIRAWLWRALERKTWPYGETYVTGDGSGAALWVPPGATSHQRLDEIELRWSLLRVAGMRRSRKVRDAARLMQSHADTGPHMELRILGVDPDRQGEGIAGHLLRPMLERCDRERLPSTLLCTKERNVGLYEHFGYAISSEISIPDGPVLWEMRREPRGGG